MLLNYFSSVQFNEEVEVKTVEGISSGSNRQEDVVEISENRIDEVLSMLHEADPTSPGKNFIASRSNETPTAIDFKKPYFL